MFRKRINDLLNEIGEVLDDYVHNKYFIQYFEKPKSHPIFGNVVEFTITLQRLPEQYDSLIECRKDDIIKAQELHKSTHGPRENLGEE